MAGNKEEQEEKPAESTAPAVASGKAAAIKGWLPLIVTLVTMPILAYATTAFVLVPKLKSPPVRLRSIPAAMRRPRTVRAEREEREVNPHTARVVGRGLTRKPRRWFR